MRSALLLAFLALVVVSICADTESEIRAKLKIPANAKRVLILSQSSHMDWDWNQTFMDYYNNKVNNILLQATTVLAEHKSDERPYYYSVAETGFLQQYWKTHPRGLDSLRASGHTLHMVGGGITSPDSLLNHGEVFIRNFLVGQQALNNVSLPTMTNIWVPDDFGHDGQLPIVVRAMGLGAAGFARVPGAVDQGPAATRLDGKPSVAQVLMNEGVSFTWEASDGSKIFAHWLQDHYNQGDDIDKFTVANNCTAYQSTINADIIITHIEGYIAANGPTSVSPYMFVAIGDDFVAPKPCLLTYIDIWNSQIYGNSKYPGSDVFVVSATFDHYTELVKAFTSNPSNNRPLTVRRFEPTPYWTGFYASRPILKILQESAVRVTTAAESLAVLTRSASEYTGALQHIWSFIAPSTHHDFVTGTAPDPVYEGEQIPYLSEANLASHILLQQLLNRIASGLSSDAEGGDKPYLIFNSLGFERPMSPLYLAEARNPEYRSFYDGHTHHFIQKTADGKIITTVGRIGSQSYLVGKLSTKEPTSESGVRFRTDHGSVIIENSHIRVTITEEANWAATSIVDLKTGQELVEPTDEDPGAFTLQMLSDAGNIYRFGNEMPDCDFGKTVYTQTALGLNLSQSEAGPVRVTVVTQVNFTSPATGQPITISRIYTLYHHEKMIRVDIQGAAPSRSSVFLRTPITLNKPVVTYGTPYHYDTHMPEVYWSGYNFLAAHNFLTLTSAEGQNLGIYSSVLRAWALDGNVLVTAVLRNTPGGSCRGYGADGSDSRTHTVGLALRVPSGLTTAPSLAPLVESLQYSTELYSSSEIGHTHATTSAPVSLVSIAAGGEAIITSVKPADLDSSKIVVRLYCPTASSQKAVSFKLNARGLIKAATPITALERPLASGEDSIKVTGVNGAQASITMTAALGTVILTPGW